MAEGPQKSMDELFAEAVRGHYKLGEGPSTARFWARAEDGYVPRPDRSLGTLQIMSALGFLGLDHFYLRSTGTGALKLLTLGGFGIWWLWDLLQVWTEQSRILDYGLTTPFDFTTGIGQGMITDKPMHYEQKSSWSGLILSTLFGFTGLPFMFLNRPWVVLRFLLAAGIGIALIAGFTASLQANGILSALWAWIVAFVFLGVFVFVFLLGVLPTWGSYVAQLFGNPNGVMEGGLTVPATSQKVFRWWRSIFKNDDNTVEPEDAMRYESVKSEWDPPARITPAELRTLFRIDRPVPDGEEETEVSSGDGIPVATIGGQIGRNTIRSIWNAAASAVARTPAGMAVSAAGDAAAAAKTVASDAAAAAREATAAARAANPIMRGGARNDTPLSTESKIIGAVLAAILAGGAVKATVNSLIPS
jgi:hypothetical protein